MKQRTLSNSYSFEGKGLHTGKPVHMKVCPAPEDSGIVFVRTDKDSARIEASAENVCKTTRSTTLSKSDVSVSTIEHLLSALTGLGIDNALVELDAPEAPILDGSALPYVQAMAADPLVEQHSERKWVEINHPIELKDEPSGAWIRIEPSDEPSYDVTIDFNSKVLGIQNVHWDPGVDYSTQIAPCRTFCFLHELQKLALIGLVKGGDVDNAIVVVEKPVGSLQMKFLSKLFHQSEKLSVSPQGYLNNLVLRFPDECGRHKLMDLIGDLRLCGGFLKAKVTAYKPGHRINTLTAKSIVEL